MTTLCLIRFADTGRFNPVVSSFGVKMTYKSFKGKPLSKKISPAVLTRKEANSFCMSGTPSWRISPTMQTLFWRKAALRAMDVNSLNAFSFMSARPYSKVNSYVKAGLIKGQFCFSGKETHAVKKNDIKNKNAIFILISL